MEWVQFSSPQLGDADCTCEPNLGVKQRILLRAKLRSSVYGKER